MSGVRNGLATLFCVSLACLMASCGSNSYQSWSGKPPPPPAAITPKIVPDGLRLTWKCVPGATHYTVFWGREPSNYKNLKDTPACSITLTGLRQGDFFRFAVTSWNEKGESKFSREFGFVFDRNPARSPHYVSVAEGLVKKASYADAHIFLAAALRLDPNNADAYRSRARLHAKLGRSEEAQRDLSKAEQIDSKQR